MDFTEQPQRIISCCTGLRGIERGLERAGVTIQPIVYLEIEAFICANLVYAMEKGILAPAPIWTDLKTFNARPLLGLVDGIIGGYPCQPFSHAGARNGTEDQRHLYPYISRIIKIANPAWCLFENVEGHLSLGFKEVSEDLRSMGYSVEAGLYSAEEVGAPHRRNRLFILAIKHNWLENARNAGVQRWSDEAIDGERQIQAARSGKLGHATSEGQQECGSGNLGKLQEKEEYGLHNIPEQSSAGKEIMAYARYAGLQRCEWGRSFRDEREAAYGSIAKRSENDWPARPGEEQYGWEEPRVKSRLGSTINGYNFREDLLRAYGNSVV